MKQKLQIAFVIIVTILLIIFVAVVANYFFGNIDEQEENIFSSLFPTFSQDEELDYIYPQKIENENNQTQTSSNTSKQNNNNQKNSNYIKFNIPLDYAVRKGNEHKTSIFEVPDIMTIKKIQIPVLDYSAEIKITNNIENETSSDNTSDIYSFDKKFGINNQIIFFICKANCPNIKSLVIDDIVIISDNQNKKYYYKMNKLGEKVSIDPDQEPYKSSNKKLIVFVNKNQKILDFFEAQYL